MARRPKDEEKKVAIDKKSGSLACSAEYYEVGSMGFRI